MSRTPSLPNNATASYGQEKWSCMIRLLESYNIDTGCYCILIKELKVIVLSERNISYF